MEEKVLSFDKVSTVAVGGQEDLAHPFCFTKKLTYVGASYNNKKTYDDAKRNNNIQSYLLNCHEITILNA